MRPIFNYENHPTNSFDQLYGSQTPETSYKKVCLRDRTGLGNSK